MMRRKTKNEKNGTPSLETNNLPIDRNPQARAEMALQLRIIGHDYATIAQRCGYYNAGAAWNAIQRLRQRARTDDQRAMAELQAVRIERAIVAVMERIEYAAPGDRLWAVDRLAPLFKRQAELLGLDAPKTSEAAPAVPTIVEVAVSLEGV